MKLQLGYGDRDFAVNSEAGLLYDPDETDNLEKKLSELGTFASSSHSQLSSNYIQVSSRIASSPS